MTDQLPDHLTYEPTGLFPYAWEQIGRDRRVWRKRDHHEAMEAKYQAVTTEAVIAARKAERPLCPVCGEPRSRKEGTTSTYNRTCGKKSCINALQSGIPALPTAPQCPYCGKPCVNKTGTTKQHQKTCGSKACKTKANSERMTKVHAERRGEAG